MQADDEDDDDNDNMMDLMKLEIQNQPFSFEPSAKQVKQDGILESTVDSAEWKLELERVLPQLKVTVHADNKVVPFSPSIVWST